METGLAYLVSILLYAIMHAYLLVHGRIAPMYQFLILMLLTFRTDRAVVQLFTRLFDGFGLCVTVSELWAMLPDLNK